MYRVLSNILRVRWPIDNKFTINGTLVSRTTVLSFSLVHSIIRETRRRGSKGGKAVRRMTAVDLAILTMRPSATSVIIDRWLSSGYTAQCICAFVLQSPTQQEVLSALKRRLEQTSVPLFPRHRLRMLSKLAEGAFGTVMTLLLHPWIISIYFQLVTSFWIKSCIVWYRRASTHTLINCN